VEDQPGTGGEPTGRDEAVGPNGAADSGDATAGDATPGADDASGTDDAGATEEAAATEPAGGAGDAGTAEPVAEQAGAASDLGGRPSDGLDATHEFDPMAEDDTESHDLDATQAHPAVPDDAATQAAAGRGVDETQVFDADATRQVPAVDDSTAVLPPAGTGAADETAVAPAVAEGWQGRATVRPAGTGYPPEAPDQGEPGEPGRAWWLPILLGVLGLLLIVGLAYGLVVATRNNSKPTPVPSPSNTPTSVAPSTPPSTPSTPPPSSVPANVTVPANLTSMSLQDAENALMQAGLTFTAMPQTVTDPNQVNRVLSASPPSGTPVSPGSSVTLTYGVAGPSQSPGPSGASPSPGPS
jgi:hypothetical protein